MEDDLNKIFAEIEHQQIEVTIYSRIRSAGNYEVSVGLSLGERHNSSTSSLSVSGVGSTYRAALADAFARIEQMQGVLGWRPTYLNPTPVPDDNIPF